MRTLAEAEATARVAIARRRSQERAQRTADRTRDVLDRLKSAQAVVDARRRRQAAVQAVLHTPRDIPIRSFPSWLDEALRDTNDSGDDYMAWPDWSTRW